MKEKIKEENISKRLKKINVNGYKSKELEKEKENNRGITLIALVITIVLNCSYLAMEQIKKLKKYRTSCII